MKERREYLVPDYYPHFSCKMGACRSACCEDWPISFTMTDYFRLLGAECSPELRRRLDCSMHLSDHPSPEAYAQISPRYDGSCPLRLPDGRCGLQAELGEEALSAVCRLYPRGVRGGNSLECSCANSCEAVIELLMAHTEPLKMVRMPLEIAEPPAAQPLIHFETAGREQEIRLWLIAFLQNREQPLPDRLLLLGEALRRMDRALQDKDTERVCDLLEGKEAISAPPSAEAGQAELVYGLEVAGQMLTLMDERSDSIRSYGEEALEFFGSGRAEFVRYALAKAHFEALLPDWESWFENMLVNHMFFTRFPFQDRPVELKDEYLALCAVYALLRFLMIGWAAGHSSREDMTDVAAAAFRLIDHTEFDRFAAPVLKRLGCEDFAHLSRLICL